MNKLSVLRIIGSVILLLLAVYFIPEYKEFAEFGNVEGMLVYGTLLGIIYFLFGIVLESERIVELIKARTYKINQGKFITMLILILLISIPISNWILWFGLGFPYPYIPFIYPEIKAILTVVSGILFVRSFEKS
ncbi:hypothetical protein [Oceanobacillus salinisoli]|uniref:hypothetical protein n=1 Tax=Oceanobacillus salinisoli TaxID=2678611 RepID=UPI0012E1ACD5|nr:hypothetical protein [Oceanobacillus salinisoli]